MSDTDSTVRTAAALLEIFKDGQAANSITAQDCRDLISSITSFIPTCAAQLQTFDTQTATVANAMNIVTFDTQHYLENVTHTVGGSSIEIEQDGVYEIIVGANFYKTGGGTAIISVGLQENLGGSPEWVTTSTAIRRDVSGNGVAGFASLGHIDRHSAGDKYRVVWWTNNTLAELQSFDPNAGSPAGQPAGHPVIPSVDFRLQRVGWL